MMLSAELCKLHCIHEVIRVTETFPADMNCLWDIFNVLKMSHKQVNAMNKLISIENVLSCKRDFVETWN